MVFKEIPLEEIDFADESYRISEELDSALLADSLSAVGQLNPVCLWEAGSQKIIVCGFRRLRALKRLGAPRVLARILPVDYADPAGVFDVALWDNLAHRQLSAIEKARALAKLKNLFGVPDERLLGFYLPLFGLAPKESVLRAHIALDGIGPELRACLIEGRLTQASLERLAEMPQEARSGFAALMDKIRLSAGLQKKVLDLLDDLSAINGAPFDEPLHHPEILPALEDPRRSPFERGERVHEMLHRFRNPRLSRAAERFAAVRKSLDLPGSIRISADPFFETPGLRVEFDAPDAKRFRDLAAALQKASQMPVLDKLFEVD